MWVNIIVICRVWKIDNNCIVRVCGVWIVSWLEELREDDVGIGVGFLEIKKIGDEYFIFIIECKDFKVCIIFFWGVSKEIFLEVECNF